MGCCVSKKRSEPPGAAGDAHSRKVVEARDLPPPEEEKVKEVLSETPRVKPRPKTRRVAGASALVAPAAEKPGNAKAGGARAKDGGAGRVRRAAAARPARSVEEKSEAASESSAATTVAGPDRSPSKPPRCGSGRQGAASGEPRRDRVPGGRASPSPRRDPAGRRSPSPAAKRSQDQRRDVAASCALRKPPVPARRAPTPRRAQDVPSSQPTRCASPPTPEAPVQEDSATKTGDHGGGEGNESLENPLVSMECFIFL